MFGVAGKVGPEEQIAAKRLISILRRRRSRHFIGESSLSSFVILLRCIRPSLTVKNYERNRPICIMYVHFYTEREGSCSVERVERKYSRNSDIVRIFCISRGSSSTVIAQHVRYLPRVYCDASFAVKRLRLVRICFLLRSNSRIAVLRTLESRKSTRVE